MTNTKVFLGMMRCHCYSYCYCYYGITHTTHIFSFNFFFSRFDTVKIQSDVLAYAEPPASNPALHIEVALTPLAIRNTYAKLGASICAPISVAPQLLPTLSTCLIPSGDCSHGHSRALRICDEDLAPATSHNRLLFLQQLFLASTTQVFATTNPSLASRLSRIL